MTFEKIEPNVWKPEKDGDAIEGILLSIEQDRGDFKSKLYHIETKDQQQFSVWGSAVLDDRMKYCSVGDNIKIEFKGMEKNKKGQDTKIFCVYKDTEKVFK